MLTPFCPPLFKTYSEEISRYFRIPQRRGGIFSRPYRLFWSSKYFTPFQKVMLTLGPRCKPPANNIVEPLTFTTWQNGTLWESGTLQIKFLQLGSSSIFAIDNYTYEKNQVIKRKKQKKRLFFSAHFPEGWESHCHSQHDFSFVIRIFTSFNLLKANKMHQ